MQMSLPPFQNHVNHLILAVREVVIRVLNEIQRMGSRPTATQRLGVDDGIVPVVVQSQIGSENETIELTYGGTTASERPCIVSTSVGLGN